MRLNLTSVIAFLLGLFLSPATSNATPVIYSNRTDFVNQISSPTVIDFSSVTGQAFYTSPGYQEGGISFTGYQFRDQTTYYWAAASNPSTSAWNFGTGALFYSSNPAYSPDAPPYIMVSVPDLYAVGFDVMTYVPGTQPTYGKDVDIWVTDAMGTYYQRINTLNRSTVIPPAFFGIVSPTPITSVRIQATVGQAAIDTFTFGAPIQLPAGGGGGNGPEPPPGETPEVATIVMIATGLIFLRLGKRRLSPAC
jgi:hypothetical protein